MILLRRTGVFEVEVNVPGTAFCSNTVTLDDSGIVALNVVIPLSAMELAGLGLGWESEKRGSFSSPGAGVAVIYGILMAVCSPGLPKMRRKGPYGSRLE